MPKVAELTGVRGGEDGFPVELWRDDDTGRPVLLLINEAGYAGTDLDLFDLIAWLASDAGKEALAAFGQEVDQPSDNSIHALTLSTR
jgi:hypothetical protein